MSVKISLENKSTIKLAVPIIFSLLGQILFAVTDNMMVGRLGAVSLAASSFVNNIINVPMVFMIGFSSAISIMVAHNKGKHDFRESGRWLFYGVLGCLFLLILIWILLSFIYWRLDVFGQPLEVLKESRGYFIVITFSLLPAIVGNAFRQFAEGLSKPIAPMVIIYICIVLNIFLNWLFIYGNWGFPQMGLMGAGWATLISRTFVFILLFFYVYYAKEFKEFHFRWKSRGQLKPHIYDLSKIGIPSGVQYLFEVMAFSGSGLIMGWLGTHALAAHQIALNLASITFMVSLGVSIAASIRVGESFGEDNKARAGTIGTGAFKMVWAFMALTGLMFLFLGRALATLYISDEKVLEIAIQFLMVAAFFQLFDGTQALAVGLLRGARDVKIPTLITLIAYWGLALPIGYVLAFHTKLGPVGIWIGLALGLGFAAVMLRRRFFEIIKTN